MGKKKRSASSTRWLNEHFKDPFVKKAHKQKLRSRAYFKLDEIQQTDRLFKPGMTVCRQPNRSEWAGYRMRYFGDGSYCRG